MKIKRSLNAFTMIELLAGIFLTTIAAGAIIVGSVHARKTINDIRLKQLAYEKLKSHTEFWKGKVAAGLSAADELLATELIFSGFFQELNPHQMAAILSCLVYSDTKSEGKPPKSEELS